VLVELLWSAKTNKGETEKEVTCKKQKQGKTRKKEGTVYQKNENNPPWSAPE
jgi:hypothetical protein